MGQGAYIFGCEGLTLSPLEAQFFRDANPWGFILFSRNVDTKEQLRRLTYDLREAVGWHAPILIDQEGGRVQRMRGPIWREFEPPLDDSLSKPDPKRAMWLRGRLIADDLLSVGIDVNCAPTLDVASDLTHPFLRNRCYGTDPVTVADLGRAMVDGMAAGGVAALMKHIPGHGRGTADSHKNLPRVSASKTELEIDFAPFKALNDLSMGMSAHIVMEAIDPERPATQSRACIDVIRNEIGFGGLLMTDDLSMQALKGNVFERGHKAIEAGCDIVLHCNGDLIEMQSVAALGNMSDIAQRRADYAATARPPAPSSRTQAIDIKALEAEFQSL
ncbi:glycoside hydrolase family 3 N-terminal domain-containing protein [Pacificibacter marinus]|uniref:glycoside hydrolase family 3 N-terminal domain-containing protein n=1 Tax=Pacificibacter marinus TaxID=658057 RepID=UPI001C07CC17|nr:glycoside hydrolase family 3 protein [Pacificibacter marinus]MBU2865438.1 glycoside hydrolase family 3 protein [Pacificibacter marinus]